MQNQFKKINIFLFLFVLALLLLSSCQKVQSSNSIPIVEKGVIDLRDWNFQADGAVNLKGQWEFYWNDFVNKGENLPGIGFATYRVRVLSGEKQQLLGIKFKERKETCDIFFYFWNNMY